MASPRRITLFSDPVHGFVSVPRGPLYDLIATPEVQRLRRIRQLGVGYMVFPGAEHSRFGHALGAMALMHDTLASLAEKGVPISKKEALAAGAAALLHDVGHGPFSHSLEPDLIDGFHHEAMSRILLLQMEPVLGAALPATLAMFDGDCARPFFHQLVSSQLDLDRMDYLRRDAFYTGVVEGQIGVERIIKTLRVTRDDRLAIEPKGIYAVESFLISRRLMYWQVYLHRAVLSGDHLLRAVIRRARARIRSGDRRLVDRGAAALTFFLENEVDATRLADPEVVRRYMELDDADILYTLKQWRELDDPVLSDLAGRVLDRRLFRVRFLADGLPSASTRDEWLGRVAAWLVRSGLSSSAESAADADLYLGIDSARHAPYESTDDPILVAHPGGTVEELTQAADSDAIASLARREVKAYVCHPKEVDLAAH